MRPVLVAALLTALCAALVAQVPDSRTYEQIVATQNKTIVDYFLLCPAVFPRTSSSDGSGSQIGIASEDDKLDTKGADLAFRRRLLAKGGQSPAPVVASALVDLKNAYIDIAGTYDNGESFRLVFVYFARADKSAIPALTYSTRGKEEDSRRYCYAFFDLRDGSWRQIPEDEILPQISVMPLVPYAGSGDTDCTYWAVELPRYGTTIRVLPILANLDEGQGSDEKATGYLEKLKPFALECAWDKARSRFADPVPALADKADLPKGPPTAADYFGLLRLDNAMDLMLDDAARRAARDAWKTSADGQKKYGPGYFEWTGGGEIGDISVQVKALGGCKGMPLVGEVDRSAEIYNYRTYLYHADSGLLEPIDLISFSARDFYKPSHQAKAKQLFGDDALDCSVGLDSAEPLFRFRPSMDNGPPIQELPPDYDLDLRWDDKAGAFVKSTEPF